MRRHEYILRGDAVREACIAELRGLELERPVRVTIEDYRKKRSAAQNRLMHMYFGLVCEAAADEQGEDDPEVWKEFFKAKFCPPAAREIAGEWFESRKTSWLDTKQASEFTDKVYRWAVENLGLILPTPGLYAEHNGDLGAIEAAMKEEHET